MTLDEVMEIIQNSMLLIAGSTLTRVLSFQFAAHRLLTIV